MGPYFRASRLTPPADKDYMSLVDDFLRHLRGALNLSKHTLRAYAGDLRRFTQFLGGETTLAAGRVDAGLVIHEARFTYHRYGLGSLVDLGEWWEADTGLPIPLGAILARRDTVEPGAATDWVRASVRHAWAHPDASRDYVLSHAQEMEPDVVARHIELYVNAYTEDLSAEGYAAADALLRRAAGAGLTPPAPVLTR